jgi:hypothetical protein
MQLMISLADRDSPSCGLSSAHAFMCCSIINDILDYSKIEAGQLSLHPSACNVATIAEAAAMLCYDMASSKGLNLSWFIEPTIPPSLQLDSTRRQRTAHAHTHTHTHTHTDASRPHLQHEAK